MGWQEREERRQEEAFQQKLARSREEWRKMGIVWEWYVTSGLSQTIINEFRIYPDRIEYVDTVSRRNSRDIPISDLTTLEVKVRTLGTKADVAVYGLNGFRWAETLPVRDAWQLKLELVSLRPDLDADSPGS